MLYDTENNNDIPLGKAGYMRRKYSLVLITMGPMANVTENAAVLKPYVGNLSYALAFLSTTLKGEFKFED